MHGIDDQHEMLDELDLDVGPPVVLLGQDPGHLQEGQRVERHPARAVGLLEPSPGGEVGPVDGADVVQAEEAAGEEVVALRVHPVDPPREVHQQLGQQAAEEVVVTAAVDVPHVQCRPGVHGRVGVAERPLVCRQRTVGVLEPLAAEHQELVLGERRVDVGQGDRVKSHVPGGEPRVLPRIRHGQDVAGVHVEPPRVAAAPSLRWWRRLGRITVQPALHVVPVELLPPDHPREGLTGDEPGVVVHVGGDHLGVELVRLTAPRREHLVELGAEARRRRRRAQADPHHLRLARCHREAVPRRRLRSFASRVHRRRTGDDMVVDAVLRVCR